MLIKKYLEPEDPDKTYYKPLFQYRTFHSRFGGLDVACLVAEATDDEFEIFNNVDWENYF